MSWIDVNDAMPELDREVIVIAYVRSTDGFASGHTPEQLMTMGMRTNLGDDAEWLLQSTLPCTIAKWQYAPERPDYELPLVGIEVDG